MNCKNVEEFLPLYAGRDLEDKRASQITAHLQTCRECARSAREYRETHQILQMFETPQFSEETFAAMRGNVLREIEQKSSAPQSRFALESLVSFIALLLQPRLRWALSTAVLLAVCAFAYYFMPHRTSVQPYGQQAVEKGGNGKQNALQEQATTMSPKDHSAQLARPDPTGTAGVPPASATGSPKPRLNMTAQTARRPTSAGVTPAVPVKSTQYSQIEPKNTFLNTSATSDKTLRLEIQTSDPNIRIIWFSLKPINEGSPIESSKGI